MLTDWIGTSSGYGISILTVKVFTSPMVPLDGELIIISKAFACGEGANQTEATTKTHALIKDTAIL